jgi:hypothetical protein
MTTPPYYQSPYDPQQPQPPPQPPNQIYYQPIFPQYRSPVVVIQQPLIPQIPLNITCPNCGVTTTSARLVAGLRVYLWCVILFIFVCIFFWVPFCIDSCHDQ